MAGLNIIRTSGNLGRQVPSEDAYSALCMSGIATAYVSLNTVYELNSINDAEALGLTVQYDTTNVVLVWHHINDFFRIAPNGKLFIMLVSQATTLTQMADSTTANGLAKLLRAPLCKGSVHQAAIALNPASGYTPLDGGTSLDGDVLTDTSGTYSGAILKAQALATQEETQHRPIVLVVEGRSFSGTSAAATDLTALDCPQVAVTIAQDADVAALNALFAGYAAVGTTLGLIARRAVNENIGWVADGNIQDQTDSIFINPALSSGNALSTYTDIEPNGDLQVLTSKGYLVPKTYVMTDGVYIKDSPTCTLASDDYSTIEDNRTIDKGIRIAYTTLVPDINRTIPVDASTGKMTPSICKYFESKVSAALAVMVQNGECSAVDVYVDPNQNVISTSVVQVRISITPTGTARSITVYIGFDNPFNQQ